MDQVGSSLRGEGRRDPTRPVRVLADPQPQVHACSPVAVLEEDVPQSQRVLATGDGHQDPVGRFEHPELLHGPFDLFPDMVDEALLAE
jgi:hypothetical protein